MSAKRVNESTTGRSSNTALRDLGKGVQVWKHSLVNDPRERLRAYQYISEATAYTPELSSVCVEKVGGGKYDGVRTFLPLGFPDSLHGVTSSCSLVSGRPSSRAASERPEPRLYSGGPPSRAASERPPSRTGTEISAIGSMPYIPSHLVAPKITSRGVTRLAGPSYGFPPPVTAPATSQPHSAEGPEKNTKQKLSTSASATLTTSAWGDTPPPISTQGVEPIPKKKVLQREIPQMRAHIPRSHSPPACGVLLPATAGPNSKGRSSARDNVSSGNSDEMKRRKLRKEAARKFLEAHREEVERTWMETRNKVRGFHYTVQEKKALKKWFESMDSDGSGEISVEELEDPLISTGVLPVKPEHVL